MVSSFNGAVDSRRRRPPASRTRRLRARGFNGPNQYAITVKVDMLQWGRRLSSTETSGGAAVVVRTRGASMGPSTLVDGDAAGQPSPDNPHLCFNGAVDSRRRRRAGGAGSKGYCSVLQWGRRLSSTETRRPSPRAGKPRTLQWGRRLSSTETPCCGRSPSASSCFNGAVDSRRRRRRRSAVASRASGRFNGAVDSRRRRRPSPGTGPRSSSELQWGRRLSSTETQQVHQVCAAEVRLQWGRRLSSTETRSANLD